MPTYSNSYNNHQDTRRIFDEIEKSLNPQRKEPVSEPKDAHIYEIIGERLQRGDKMAIVGCWCIGLASMLVSVICIYKIWTRPGKFVKKTLWSLTALIPIFGWLAYVGFYRTPKRHKAGDMCPGNSAAFYGGSLH